LVVVINEVALRRARLVLREVIVRTDLVLFNQLPAAKSAWPFLRR